MANYGLQIGTTQFVGFTHAKRNMYGLSNGTNEIDIAKLGVVLKEETWGNKRFYEDNFELGKVKGVAENLWWRPSNGAYITYQSYFSGTTGAFHVSGKILTIGAQFNKIDNYGICVNGAYFSSADILIKQTTNLNLKTEYGKGSVLGTVRIIDQCFHLRSLIEKLWDVVNAKTLHEDSDYRLECKDGALRFWALAYEYNQGFNVNLDCYI
ncbi:hypothetical protein NYR30_06625 [Gallibacterium salpingitidis]|uniref:hypothetical protein n=1 Tax=Gallibacterium salpingitidis TaxID=505341 RepID=UPI0026709926|nr:hypothetical protein [Gallibacterium salpingitidis]WKT00940.1 hypothetical protein NYR30_06625 [Gallibacterium salpingitidis]